MRTIFLLINCWLSGNRAVKQEMKGEWNIEKKEIWIAEGTLFPAVSNYTYVENLNLKMLLYTRIMSNILWETV